MLFTTPIPISPSPFQLTHRHRILLLGSCFADNIGELLRRDKFDCLVNPFGTLYNPSSIAAHLWRCISENEYTPDSPEIFSPSSPETNSFFSWLHHSSFSAPTRPILLARLNAALHTTATRLRQADLLIVTFGTAYIYRLKSTGMLVANCHKQPDALFARHRLSSFDIVDQWAPLLEMLHSINPHQHVIFTVSPIRHKRDGLHENQLSKAELLLAIDQLVTSPPSPNVARGFAPSNPSHSVARGFASSVPTYFPAYELLLDELRDYRFYAPDMVHPSPLAIDYIYERFCDAYLAQDEQALSRQCRSIHAALHHHPFDPTSTSHQSFLTHTLQKINELKKQHPYINWDDELTLCNTQSKK